MADKRFKLDPEAIRELEEHDLAHVAGGATIVLPLPVPTRPPVIRPIPIVGRPPIRPPGPVLLPGGVPGIVTIPGRLNPWGWT